MKVGEPMGVPRRRVPWVRWDDGPRAARVVGSAGCVLGVEGSRVESRVVFFRFSLAPIACPCN